MKAFNAKEFVNFIKVHQVNFVIILIIIISNIAFANFFLKGALGELNKLNQEIAQKKKEIDTKKKTGQDLEAQKKEIDRLSSQYHELEKMFLPREGGQLFLGELNRLARMSDVKIVSLDPGISVANNISGKKFLEFPFNINLEGGYHELCKFINRLENSKDRVISIKRFQIRSTPNDAWAHSCDLQIGTYGIE